MWCDRWGSVGHLLRRVLMTGCGPGGTADSPQPSAAEVLALLERALEIVDRLKLPANVGARLKEAIDALIAVG